MSVYLAKFHKDIVAVFYCFYVTGREETLADNSQKVFCLRSFEKVQQPPS